MKPPPSLWRLPTQVHIQMIPSPRKIADTRQILSALQKFGEVTTFRNLKVIDSATRATQKPQLTSTQYDISNDSPNKHRPILAIFDSPDAAQRAIASSPMTITLDTPTQPTPISISTSTSAPKSDSDSNSKSPSSSEPTKEYKTHDPIFDNIAPGTIKCIIEPSSHNHESALWRNPYHGMFIVNENDPIYKDMNDERTGTPLKVLGDFLASKKERNAMTDAQRKQANRRLFKRQSLTDEWRAGLPGRTVPVSRIKELHEV
ncbi:hypothetical protein N7490_001582 [Penicillium lividum]|nr:hypothetical protein N7490_001582 [Penicillium lividum]